MGKEWIFDNWFVRNYPRLRKVFGQYLNEDALHDAYLVMKCEVARSQVAPDKFEPYFSEYIRNADKDVHTGITATSCLMNISFCA